MIVWETVAVAFSMFSIVPMPQLQWKQGNLRYALCAFPLVGVVLGGLCWCAALLCQVLEFPSLLRGTLLTLLPVAVTGGIHLDGYCDTWDALASHAGPERRREILRDPHIGAFGAMRLCGYFLLTLALWTALPEYRWLPIWLSFCLSRCLSGLAVSLFPLATNTGLAYIFATHADKKRVTIILMTQTVACAVWLCLCGISGAVMVVVGGLVFWRYYRTAMKQFGGLSGDLAGWFLQRAELWMLAALCIVEHLEVLL